MTAAELRDLCLSFPGAEETFPFGDVPSVFKVGGKMFALSALAREPLAVNLKCEPDLAAQLRGAYESVTPGWHMNKRHWNTVVLGGDADDETVRELVEDSYDLVVSGLPKKVQAKLGWSPDV